MITRNLPLFEFVKSRFDGRCLYDYQLEMLRGMLEHDRIVAVCARQSGKSETVGCTVVIEAMRRPNQHILIVAPTDRQAGELFLKVLYYLKLPGIIGMVSSLSQRSAVLNNGCRITAAPVGHNGDNLRSMTANVLVLEEAAYIKDDVIIDVLMPMVSTPGSKLIKISTPRGKNHFYKSYIDKERYTVFKYTWKDAVKAGRYTQEFIDEARDNSTELQFDVEYNAEFVEGADNYFSSALIDKCTDIEIEQEFIPKKDKIYFMGIDVAYAGKDKSVFTIIESDEQYSYGKAVHIFEYITNNTGTAFDKACELQHIWKCKKIFPDATTTGSGLAMLLIRKFNNSTTKSPDDIVEAYTFTNKSKIDMYSNLKLHMEHNHIRFPNNKNLIYQLQDFRYELSDKSDAVKLHHSVGGHDDYPDSIGLACLGIHKGRIPQMYYGGSIEDREKRAIDKRKQLENKLKERGII